MEVVTRANSSLFAIRKNRNLSQSHRTAQEGSSHGNYQDTSKTGESPPKKVRAKKSKPRVQVRVRHEKKLIKKTRKKKEKGTSIVKFGK